ncbi:radical SAM protein [Stetteria hydrogenophila]
MGRCAVCGRESRLVSSWLGVCAECLRRRPGEALERVRRVRRLWRSRLGLPGDPPRAGGSGARCALCVNECVIPDGGVGYCGVWRARGGRLEHVAGPGRILGFTYLDPLPTNCVATPVCPAATGRGYPEYTDTEGPEYGYYNLAVFLGGCPLDCAFCQNWEHKLMVARARPPSLEGVPSTAVPRRTVMTVEELVEEALDPRVRCVCYFGGDPTPQAGILVAASRRILREARRRGQAFKRICWETDGLAHPRLMREMARVSLESGGVVKIDWKAWTPSIYEALTGVDGWRAVERLKANTRLVAEMGRERGDPPLLVVSTLLVPGYVGPGEVYRIASYLASIDPGIPMVLLAFHPDHRMPDLPTTSVDHAEKALEAARRAGLREVYLGNEWLLKPSYKVEPWWGE